MPRTAPRMRCSLMHQAPVVDPSASLRRSLYRPRRAMLVGGAFLALLTALLGAAAWTFVLTVFQDYDDEGYILLTLRQFVQGHPLYDAVYSQYGPFYYLVGWLLCRPGLVPVSHDAAGTATSIVWLACCVLAALTTWRLTRNILLTAAIELVTFTHLFDLTYEAGHPQGLATLLVMLLVCLSTDALSRRTATFGAIGLVVGCLLLTKINVGLFAILSLAMTAAAFTAGRLARTLVIALGLVMIALPFMLMRERWPEPWVLHYALAIALSAVPIVLLHWYTDEALVRWGDARAAAIGCMIALTTMAAFTWVQGTSLTGMVDGILLQHLRFASVYYLPAPISSAASLAAALGVVVFLIFCWLQVRNPGHPGVQFAIRLAQGLFAAMVVYGAERQGFVFLLSLATPFVWLAALAPKGSRPSDRFARLALVSVAVLQALVAYPVAGTQLALATVLLVLAAGICLGDLVQSAGHLLSGVRVHTWPRALAGLVAGVVLLAFAGQAALAGFRFHASRNSLALDGAHWLHTDEAHRAAFAWLAHNLHAHADTFVSLPGLNSLYFWSGTEPPTTWNTTTWMTLFDPRRQARIVRAAGEHPRICAVRNTRHAARWLRGQSIDHLPLVAYIDDEFRTVGSFGGYDLRVQKDRTDPELLFCATPPLPRGEPAAAGWSPRIVLPPMPAQTLHRVTLVAPATGDVLADSAAPARDLHLEIIPENANRPRNLSSEPIDLSGGSRLRLQVAAVERLPRDVTLVVQLRDAAGHAFATLPVLE